MGTGIALVCAQAGLDVLLNDIAEERVQAALATINGSLVAPDRQGSARRGRPHRRRSTASASPPTLRRSRRLRSGDRGGVGERGRQAQDLRRPAPFLKPEAIVASNTSSISITRLASVTAHPERFIGIHFMNPVPRMQLVELIRGIATTDETFETAKAFVARLGKTATMSEDFPAFIVNRILLPMINEAIYTLYEGVGSVEAIDTAMRLGANHPMGPLQLADFIGLDTCLCGDAGAARGPRRFQIPALPAAGEIRRGGLARPQDAARLLRLSRRDIRCRRDKAFSRSLRERRPEGRGGRGGLTPNPAASPA